MNVCVDMRRVPWHHKFGVIESAGDGGVEIVSNSETGEESKGRKYLWNLTTGKVK